MPKALVCYYSVTHNTEKMAVRIAEVLRAEGLEVDLKNETTILDILNAFLIHGMVVRGDYRGDHYGPVSIGRPDKRALANCEGYAKFVAALVKKLFP